MPGQATRLSFVDGGIYWRMIFRDPSEVVIFFITIIVIIIIIAFVGDDA